MQRAQVTSRMRMRAHGATGYRLLDFYSLKVFWFHWTVLVHPWAVWDGVPWVTVSVKLLTVRRILYVVGKFPDNAGRFPCLSDQQRAQSRYALWEEP